MTELWAHQVAAIERAKHRSSFAFFFDIGTGKTLAAIETIRYIYNLNQRIKRTLIFSPLSVCAQWKQEFLKFSKIPPDQIQVLTMEGKKRVKLLESTGGPIICTNYEATTIPDFYDALLRWKPEILIYDELHWCKDSTTQRSKKLLPFSEGSEYRYGLTGTPILQSPMDLFGQYRLLDLGQEFGTSYFRFRKLYCMDRNAGMPKHRYFPKWEVKPEAIPVFAKILAETSAQANKSECLDLPPLLKIEVPIEMSPEQTKLYDTMKRDFIVEFKGEIATAEFAMTKSLRLQQILCGFVSSGEEDSSPRWVEDNTRLRALEELLESLSGKKVIIWTVFQPTYKVIGKLCEKLGRSYAFLTGEQSPKQKQESIDTFTKGDVETIISNPAAGGTGINLTEASYSIYFARTYSLAHYLQSEGRNYRGGSLEKVTHYHLVTKDSLDEAVLDALQNKKNVGDTIIAYAKAEIEKQRKDDL